jgi:hypothetical protein
VQRLATLVSNCAAAGIARQVLLLRIDRLPPSLTRAHHLRLAEGSLAPLLRAPRAELFHLPGPRLAVVWRGDAETALLSTVQALDRLLDDAPISAPGLADLASLFDLPADGAALMAALSDTVPNEAELATPPSPPLDPASLTLLEASLAHADVARFARRRAVWRLEPRSASLAWEERTLSVAELADGLVPGHDLQREAWLFRRLTRTLDRRLLALLASPGELAGAGPFALELNLASVLGAEFQRFDAALPPGLRGHVVLALDPADLVADAASFSFARGLAQARDYRLMLRDATPELLQVLPAAGLGLDYLAVPWSESLRGDAGTLLQSCPESHIVLAGCDTTAALAWGEDIGVSLFMGRAADRAALGERTATA